MKNLLIPGLICLVACSKKMDKQADAINTITEKQHCDFGITDFNLAKRSPVNEEMPGAGNQTFSLNQSSKTTSINDGVIYLDFDGQSVTGTVWNNSIGNINCAPANLTASGISTIIQRVSNDFSSFNIIVTTNESDYNSANINKRTRVIITETWQWYGLAGGGAVLNSFISGTNTPCFVFSSLLGYNLKWIAEAASHEAGHTLGLRHQSVYDASCQKVSEYNAGQGSGETSWAPIMGNSYYKNLSLWHKGPNALGCTTIQDDVAKIASVVGYKTDDHSNTISGATVFASSVDGIINDSSDIDFFQINATSEKKIYINPFNVGINNTGANLDLVVKVYNAQGGLISLNQYPGFLFTETGIPAGGYSFSVATIANQFTSRYGMLGMYRVRVY